MEGRELGALRSHRRPASGDPFPKFQRVFDRARQPLVFLCFLGLLWAEKTSLLTAIADYARKAVGEKGHLRGHEIPEIELLAARNVCDDHILRSPNDSKVRHTAKRELRLLDEILTDDSDDRSKCDRILGLITGPEKTGGRASSVPTAIMV